MVSVLMCAFNEKEEWIRNAIESILSQTYEKFEFIIILDNPNNIILENVIRSFERNDPRVKMYINDQNEGLVYSLNKGLSITKGEFVARMDADDIAYNERLELQLKFLKNNPEYDLIGTDINYIDEDGKIIGSNKVNISDFNFIKAALRYRNIMCHPSLMYRKKSIVNIGGYKDIRFAEDYDLITRLILNGSKITNLNDTLLSYRIRTNGISKTNAIAQRYSALYVRKNYKNKNMKLQKDYFLEKNGFNILKEVIRVKDKILFNVINIASKIIEDKLNYYSKRR
jgi:hypothetical protein